MSIEASYAVWEAYFREELTVEEVARRLLDSDEATGDWGFALPEVPDAVERAEQLLMALSMAVQQRDSASPPA
jgi:hypothetical protein